MRLFITTRAIPTLLMVIKRYSITPQPLTTLPLATGLYF